MADTSRATRYSPWLSLLPRYWLPLFESNTLDGTSFGASTSGYDIIGRHSYTLEALRNNRFQENSAWLWYRYAGLGMPVLDLYASQDFGHDVVQRQTGNVIDTVGNFSERDRIASLLATFIRPRFRSYSIASIGGELEAISYSTRPDTLLPHLSPFFSKSYTYPAIVGSAGWSNAQRPGLSISPEDGITASVNARQRWQRGTAGGSTRSVEAVSSLYKSLDLPGFAHHVLALRGALGWKDERSVDFFSAGGISGTSLEIIPGVLAGQQRRIFGVRGYAISAEQGIRAYSGSVEYRAPLIAPSRGFRFLPVFIDKMSLTLFGETGRAWCPASAAASAAGLCDASNVGTPVMTSVGAELNADTGIQLDLPARLRVGVAFPVANREQFKTRAGNLYGTFGASF